MEWLLMLPDPNPIKNIWSLLQNEVYRGKKVYKNTTDLWNVISAAWHFPCRVTWFLPHLLADLGCSLY
jgi:hypothetical protein